MKIYRVEIYSPSEDDWFIFSYHKTLEGAAKACDSRIEKFLTLANHHECVADGNGNRIWTIEVDD